MEEPEERGAADDEQHRARDGEGYRINARALEQGQRGSPIFRADSIGGPCQKQLREGAGAAGVASGERGLGGSERTLVRPTPLTAPTLGGLVACGLIVCLSHERRRTTIRAAGASRFAPGSNGGVVFIAPRRESL